MPNNTNETTTNNILYRLDSSDKTLKYGAPRLIPINKTGISFLFTNPIRESSKLL